MTTAFMLVFIAVCFSVTGELLLKTGMNQVGVLSLNKFGALIPKMLRTWQLLAGLGAITIGAGFWLMAISRVDLSWAYPLLAMGYILILIFSAIFLREHVTLLRWIGAALIVLGVYLITRS
jgi:multidrug transporter EmrE-like cation transporter